MINGRSDNPQSIRTVIDSNYILLAIRLDGRLHPLQSQVAEQLKIDQLVSLPCHRLSDCQTARLLQIEGYQIRWFAGMS
jgi:hypothetical protein